MLDGTGLTARSPTSQQYRYYAVRKRAIDMTDDELAAIASGATLTVVK